jgi:shikimate kinase
MDVVLVGLPGSGKTAVGRRLASRHNAQFVDLDERIEHGDGRTIREIFAQDGEAGFRRLEREAVLALGAPDPSAEIRRVISPGGGSVVDPRNRWLLFRDRMPVWLDVRPEVLAQRLRRSPTVRPLVQGSDPLGRIRQLAAARERFYSAAARVNGLSEVATVVSAVDRLAEERGPLPATTLLRAATPIGEIVLGDGIAAEAVGAALRRLSARRAVVVSEPGAWTAFGEGLATSLRADEWPVEVMLLPSGEEAKRLAVIEEAAQALATRRASWPRRTSGACPGSACPRRSSPRWIRRSVARPAWTCRRARTSSGRSTTPPPSSSTSRRCGRSPSASCGPRWARS